MRLLIVGWGLGWPSVAASGSFESFQIPRRDIKNMPPPISTLPWSHIDISFSVFYLGPLLTLALVPLLFCSETSDSGLVVNLNKWDLWINGAFLTMVKWCVIWSNQATLFPQKPWEVFSPFYQPWLFVVVRQCNWVRLSVTLDFRDIWLEWCLDKKTKTSFLLWCQGSFALLRCFHWMDILLNWIQQTFWIEYVRKSVDFHSICVDLNLS